MRGWDNFVLRVEYLFESCYCSAKRQNAKRLIFNFRQILVQIPKPDRRELNIRVGNRSLNERATVVLFCVEQCECAKERMARTFIFYVEFGMFHV